MQMQQDSESDVLEAVPTVKVNAVELENHALSYAVALAEGESVHVEGGYVLDVNRLEVDYTSPEQAAEIREREGLITLPSESEGGFFAFRADPDDDTTVNGPTETVAAMRLHVLRKLGEAVEVPAELVED